MGLRRSKSGSHRSTQSRNENENDAGTPSAKNGDEGQVSKSLGVGTDPATNWSRLTRARSLSNTLGDYFRSKRQKKDGDGGEDEEAGPSGS